jgi:hypothetical protein
MVDYEVTTLKWDFSKYTMDMKGDNLVDTFTFGLIIINHPHFGQNCFWFH